MMMKDNGGVKEEDEDRTSSQIKLPLVIRIGPRPERTMIVETTKQQPTQAGANSSPLSSNRSLLPRLEKARSFINLPDDHHQQILLNKLISIKLLNSTPTHSPLPQQQPMFVNRGLGDNHQYKSSMFSLDPLWTRMEATAASMNYLLVSMLKRGDLINDDGNEDENDNGAGTMLVKHKPSSVSSSPLLFSSSHHRTHKLFIMKAMSRTPTSTTTNESVVLPNSQSQQAATAKANNNTTIKKSTSTLYLKTKAKTSTAAATATTNTCKLVEYAKQTSSCSNLSKVVQTCLSADCRFVYIIREYATETLEDVLRRSSGSGTTSGNNSNNSNFPNRVCVPFRLIKNWLMQAVNALDYLHNSMHTCHTNLKPSNILLVASHIKLADFLLEPTGCLPRRVAKSARNRPYLPRESIESFTYSPKSDVYSLAAIFAELLGAKTVEDLLAHSSAARPETDPDEYFGKVLAVMMSPIDTDRPASNDLALLLKFFDSIEFSRRLSVRNFAYLIKFKQATNDKKYFLKAVNLDKHCLQDVLTDLSRVLPSHDNLVATTRHLVIGSRIYILRDYYDDLMNVQQRLYQHHPRKIDESILFQKWLGQIIDGLEHLHANNILHGNLKPENVLVRIKDDHIKLTDFGYNHRIQLTDSQLNPNTGEEYSKSSDVYQLGYLLYRCMRSITDLNYLNELNSTNAQSDRIVDLERLDEMEFGKRAKKYVRQMLDNSVEMRPTLAELKSHLISPFYVDLLHGDRLAPIELDRKILAMEAIDSESFLAISFVKRRNHIGFSLSRLKFDAQANLGLVERVNFNSAILMARNRMSPSCCSCSKFIQISLDYPGLLPKFLCLIDAGLFIGCNSNFVYFFNDRFRYMKRMCLLEMLESSPITFSGSNNTNGSSPTRKHTNLTENHRRHSTMVKKHELKIEVNSLCIDRLANANTYRIFMLLSVLNELCLLNLFRLDLTEFNRQLAESTKSGLKSFKSLMDMCDPIVSLESTIHLNILKPDVEKSMKCNQKYLFVCERSHKVRVFSKQPDSMGKYLFSLDENGTGGSMVDNRRFFVDPRLQSHPIKRSSHMLGGYFSNRLQDLDVDKRNGYIYVVYEYAIRVHDENCELVWEFDMGARSDLSGKLNKVCFTPAGTMALVLEDHKNEFANRVYLFN